MEIWSGPWETRQDGTSGGARVLTKADTAVCWESVSGGAKTNFGVSMIQDVIEAELCAHIVV